MGGQYNKPRHASEYAKQAADKITGAAGYTVRAKTHSGLNEAERENSGTEAAHKAELIGEKAGKAMKRNLRKRRGAKQYAAKAKAAASSGVKATEKMRNIISTVIKKRNSGAAVIIGILFMLIISIQSCMAGAFNIGSSLEGISGGTAYLADDDDINAVELAYTEWETDLLIRAESSSALFPGYDEYRYNIGTPGHGPFALLAFLTAKYDDFTYPETESILRGLFEEQYALTYTVTSRRAGSRENRHTIYMLTTTLSVKPFTSVITPKLGTEEEKERYGVYMLLKGNRQCVGNPFDFNWLQNVSSYYGYRVHPVTGIKDCHTGLDIATPTGTRILAGGKGVVLEAKTHDSYGLTMLVDYGNGINVRYAHCSALLASTGQEVNTKEVIALSGNTGTSTGPHLHMEVMKNGAYMNPIFYLDGSQGAL